LADVAEVTHFFDHISVAVLELKGALKVGEKIAFFDKENKLFEQVIDSMQVDHKPVQLAKKGEAIGLKVLHPVKEGFRVEKV